MTSNEAPWRGVHVSQLQTSLNHPQFPKLVSDEEHTILFRLPVSADKVPECFPSIFKKRDFWDSNHVKLPCSDKNVTRDQINRWNLIRNALTSQILSAEQLQAAILNYNSRYAEQWDFSTLHLFFEHEIDELESAMVFEGLLPKIIDLALRLPELITGGIPLLKRGHKRSVSLSQLQISSLLANGFLCTFPHRNSCRKDAEYFDYPDINFNRLFQCNYQDRTQSVFEKIKCLLNYFRRVTSKVPTGVVTYSRQLVPNNLYPNWSKSSKILPQLHVSSEGTIEDDGFGLFQVDFANKFVGGGVIGTGCVQEEIRFVICPELIISRLFTQSLGENEALVITGCERFNKYKGYGNTFEWDGNYKDGTPSDEYGRKYCTVIALDALHFMQNPLDQYLPKNITRDLNKAYVGFSWNSRQKKEELCAVATGNWGCGAFRGDPKLKSFLQLIAAGEVGRDLAYFTFGDTELRDGLAETHQFLVQNKVTIGKLYSLLGEYYSKEFFKTVDIFAFFRNEALKKTEMESDPSKMNVSCGFRRLEITKKRSFCYRTKVSDWFRPTSETDSSKMDLNSSKVSVNSSEGEVRVDEPESELVAEKRASEMRMLKHFYQQPTEDGWPGKVESPSTENGFEFLDKFKASLKRRASVMKGTHRSASKENSCDVAAEEQDQSDDTNRGTDVENVCPSGGFIEECESAMNVNAEVTKVSESSITNSAPKLEPVENSVCENAEMDRLCDDISEEVDVTNKEVENGESCSPKQTSRASKSPRETHEVNEASEKEESDLDMLISNNSCTVESTTEDKVDLDCQILINSKSEKAEKENLNRNRVATLSSLAAQLKQSKTPKRTTPTSSKYSFHSFSASKKRKISDYFRPKTQ